MKLKIYLIAAVLCFVTSFPAWAASVSVPKTGQTSCSNESGSGLACTGSGQDGDTLAG